MKALGATLIPVSYEIAWKALDERSFAGVNGTFIHPFDDDDFIAGHGTMGLEILEDAPDVAAVIASIGGGGLITGVASSIKALRPEVKIFGVEPETAAPAALSFEKGSPQAFPDWKSSFVDGAGRSKHVPSHVGTHETNCGRLPRCHSRGYKKCDATDGGKSTCHC